jgi:hypothetical protein
MNNFRGVKFHQLGVPMPIDDAHLNFQLRHQGKLFRDMDALKQIEMVRGPASAIWPPGVELRISDAFHRPVWRRHSAG